MTISNIGAPNRWSQNLPVLLSVGAIFCFSIMDATVKSVSSEIGPLPALWGRYAGQMLIVFCLVLPRIKVVAQSKYPGLQVARSVLLMCATFFFFLGLSQIGLAQATAVMNLNPVLITLGAAMFLGERLGHRRIIAIAFSLAGALIIIRPGTQAFSIAAILPLFAACCFAGYTLITRKVGHDEDVWTSLFYTGLVGSLLMTLIVPFFWIAPSPAAWLKLGFIGGIGTLGQLLLIQALTRAEAGMLAPFNYTSLIFASLWGAVLFGVLPDGQTITGALVIAGAGLYVWHRERQSGAAGQPE